LRQSQNWRPIYIQAAQYGQQPLQRRPIARLNGLLPCSVIEVSFDHAFIEIGQLRAASCDPTQEITDQIQASPSAVTSESVFDEPRRVEFNELSVGSALEAPE
jgi:hypothetical protein